MIEFSHRVDLSSYFAEVDAKIAVNNDWLEEHGLRDVERLALRVWQGRRQNAPDEIREDPEWVTVDADNRSVDHHVSRFPTKRENAERVYTEGPEGIFCGDPRNSPDAYEWNFRLWTDFSRKNDHSAFELQFRTLEHCCHLVERALDGKDVPEDVQFVVDSAGALTKKDFETAVVPYITIYKSPDGKPVLYYLPNRSNGCILHIHVMHKAVIVGQFYSEDQRLPERTVKIVDEPTFIRLVFDMGTWMVWSELPVEESTVKGPLPFLDDLVLSEVIEDV